MSGEAAVEHLREAHALIDDPIRQSRDRAAARPPALPPPRRGGGRRLHRGARRARRRRRRARAPARGRAHHQRPVRAGAPPRGARAARARPQPARGRDPRREAAALAARLPRCAGGRAGRGGRPARAPSARRGDAAPGGRLGTRLRPACMVLAMADLDEALTVYEDALAEAHRRGSILAFAAAKVFRAQTLCLARRPGRGGSRAREALAAGEAWGRPLASRGTPPPFSPTR